MGVGYEVDQVEYICNPKLVRAFQQAKLDLAKQHDFMLESMKPVLLFHGTHEQSMENIFKTNFLVEKIGSKTDQGWYGRGFYFSEYPSMVRYNNNLTHNLFCLFNSLTNFCLIF